jgi:hypothetical protein
MVLQKEELPIGGRGRVAYGETTRRRDKTGAADRAAQQEPSDHLTHSGLIRERRVNRPAFPMHRLSVVGQLRRLAIRCQEGRDKPSGLLAIPISRPDAPGYQLSRAIDQETGRRGADPVQSRDARVAIEQHGKRQLVLVQIGLYRVGRLTDVDGQDDELLLPEAPVETLE